MSGADRSFRSIVLVAAGRSPAAEARSLHGRRSACVEADPAATSGAGIEPAVGHREASDRRTAGGDATEPLHDVFLRAILVHRPRPGNGHAGTTSGSRPRPPLGCPPRGHDRDARSAAVEPARLDRPARGDVLDQLAGLGPGLGRGCGRPNGPAKARRAPLDVEAGVPGRRACDGALDPLAGTGRKRAVPSAIRSPGDSRTAQEGRRLSHSRTVGAAVAVTLPASRVAGDRMACPATPGLRGTKD